MNRKSRSEAGVGDKPSPSPPPADVLLGRSDGGGEELDQGLCLLSEPSSRRSARAACPLLPGLRLRRLQLCLPRAQLPQVRPDTVLLVIQQL